METGTTKTEPALTSNHRSTPSAPELGLLESHTTFIDLLQDRNLDMSFGRSQKLTDPFTKFRTLNLPEDYLERMPELERQVKEYHNTIRLRYDVMPAKTQLKRNTTEQKLTVSPQCDHEPSA